MHYLLSFPLSRGLFLFLFIAGLPLFMKAQSTDQINFSVESLQLNEETIIYQDDLIVVSLVKTIFESPQDGISHERINYIFKNLSSSKVNVSFNRLAVYLPESQTVGEMKQLEILLEPLAVTDCLTYPRDKRFYTFSKDLKKTISKELISISFLNLEVR